MEQENLTSREWEAIHTRFSLLRPVIRQMMDVASCRLETQGNKCKNSRSPVDSGLVSLVDCVLWPGDVGNSTRPVWRAKRAELLARAPVMHNPRGTHANE